MGALASGRPHRRPACGAKHHGGGGLGQPPADAIEASALRARPRWRGRSAPGACGAPRVSGQKATRPKLADCVAPNCNLAPKGGDELRPDNSPTGNCCCLFLRKAVTLKEKQDFVFQFGNDHKIKQEVKCKLSGTTAEEQFKNWETDMREPLSAPNYGIENYFKKP